MASAETSLAWHHPDATNAASGSSGIVVLLAALVPKRLWEVR
jgi:hypothetical protein